MEFQTRSEENGLQFHPTLEAAMESAKKDPTIWKISFGLPNGERVRLVRYVYGYHDEEWKYEPMFTKEQLAEMHDKYQVRKDQRL